jgi:hypothetical protein
MEKFEAGKDTSGDKVTDDDDDDKKLTDKVKDKITDKIKDENPEEPEDYGLLGQFLKMVGFK